MDQEQPTNQEVVETIMSAMTELESKMATKKDLKGFATKEDLGKLKYDILDGMDNKLADLKGDLIIMMRKEDQKVTELIKLLGHKTILTKVETDQLLRLRPFPQLQT